MTYDTYSRLPNVPFPEELTNARTEAEELESLASKAIFGIPQTIYPNSVELIPELGLQALPSTFDPLEMAANIEQAMTQFSFVGYAYAIALNGQLATSKGLGFANDKISEGVGVFKMEPTSRVHLASLTKPLTAIGILRLIEMDKDITLQSGFYNFIESKFPNAHSAYRNITLEQLLSHSGGVDVNRDFYCSEIEEALSTQPSVAGAYNYANMNYCLLREVIEGAANEDYLSFMQNNVLNPAGISNGSCEWQDSSTYSWRWQAGGGTPQSDGDYSSVCGAYGMYFSAIEYVRLLAFLRFGKIIDRNSTLVDMLNKGTNAYRLGVSSVNSNLSGRSYWGHSGRWTNGGYGTRTGMFFTNDGVDAVILCNTAIQREPSLVTVLRNAYEAAFD